jgi:hypothetical protein
MTWTSPNKPRAHTHTHTCTHTRAHTHARTHAHAHTETNTLARPHARTHAAGLKQTAPASQAHRNTALAYTLHKGPVGRWREWWPCEGAGATRRQHCPASASASQRAPHCGRKVGLKVKPGASLDAALSSVPTQWESVTFCRQTYGHIRNAPSGLGLGYFSNGQIRMKFERWNADMALK